MIRYKNKWCEKYLPPTIFHWIWLLVCVVWFILLLKGGMKLREQNLFLESLRSNL